MTRTLLQCRLDAFILIRFLFMELILVNVLVSIFNVMGFLILFGMIQNRLYLRHLNIVLVLVCLFSGHL